MGRPLVGNSRFEKYKHLLTVIGALIVFVTFVVRDAIRDQVKERVDSLGAADYQFTESTDIDYIASLLMNIGNEIEATHRKGPLHGHTALAEADEWVSELSLVCRWLVSGSIWSPRWYRRI